MSGTAHIVFKMLASIAGLVAAAAVAQDFDVTRSTIDGGGLMGSTGGGFQLSGTIGQPDAGVLTSGGGLTLAGGFWFGQSPGDSNEDGRINLLDYTELNVCASGPDDGFVAPSCAFFDFDGDQDVDLEDVGAFQRLFSGL
jgi:hypothetical protein